MQSESKPFGQKDTGSFNDWFKYSLWKLTFLYVGILAVILFLSSSVIYSAFSYQLGSRYRNMRTLPPTYLEERRDTPPTREELQADLIQSLIAVNGILLIAAGVASYWLALITLQPLKTAYERERRFLADASHELRTPLSILKMDLENAATRLSAPPLHEHIKSGLEEVDRMSNLIKDLLALSRLGEEEFGKDSQTSPLDLTALVRTTVERLKPLAKRHEVTLNFVEPKASTAITSNEELILHSITNVIKNAIVYNKPHGSVNIYMRPESNYVFLEVTDTGIGIPESDLSKVFDRFYRVDKSRSRQTGGSGLGLSIVRSSLEHLGGEVYIRSALGEGTTITLKIPRT